MGNPRCRAYSFNWVKLSIPVVLASARAEDRTVLTGLLAGSPWMLVETSTPAQAVQALRLAKFPIVLFDPTLAGTHAPNRVQTMLRSFLRARRGACAILLLDDPPGSDCIPPALAFDAVVRPLDKEQVFRALFFAYSHCKIKWPIGVLPRAPKQAITSTGQ